jgi:SulP family sulfate permease
MNGIAIIIIMSQVETIQNGLLIVLLTIAAMLFSGKYIKMIPSSLVALIAGTLLVFFAEPFFPQASFPVPFLGDISLLKQVDLIGQIPGGLPSFHRPNLDLVLWMQLIPPALSIAILGSIDSLLTSVIMDNITGKKHRSNKELIGQGIGNAISGLFGGLAGAGATVRSVVNIKSGGRTAISAMAHSVVLLLFMLVLGGLVSQIPLAVLAGILVITGISMFDYHSIKLLKREPKEDAAAMLVTMVLTVVIDLMVAVGAGIILSSLLFMKRMSEEGFKLTKEALDGSENKYTVITLEGPLYFGACNRLSNIVMETDSKFVVLDLSSVSTLDASGALTLGQLSTQLKEREQTLILIGVKEITRVRLAGMKVLDQMDLNCVYESSDKELSFIKEHHPHKMKMPVATH